MSIFVAIGLVAVSEKKIFEGFTTYGHGGHLCHMTRFIYKYIGSPFIQMIPIKFDFDWPSCFREEL